uniref:Uncharacterized protein n=1 Tax=Rhizophora mucronata TaxID=61149 RepID=A0A2P2QYI5_RHIMU
MTLFLKMGMRTYCSDKGCNEDKVIIKQNKLWFH